MHIEILREKINRASLPQQALETAEYELSRLERVSPASAEYTMISGYIDWVVSLPWQTSSQQDVDISKARSILNEDLLGLRSAKEQVLEFIAVARSSLTSVSPVLCLSGPPGMGKATLSQSIARALGRRFIRISIQSIRDESEILGEWRVNIGNRPGLIIRSLRDCGQNDPVFLIDAIDSITSESSTDLISAILAMIHPEKRSSFHDRYLNLPFDLSRALFITTANASSTVPDRLQSITETISLPGYTNRNKLRIAKSYIIPRRLEQTALQVDEIEFSDEALEELTQGYTFEAGVYQLDQQIGRIFRRMVKRQLEKGGLMTKIKKSDIADLLGPPTVTPETIGRLPEVGLSTALICSRAGGTLAFIEATRMIGSGRVRITGNPPQPVEELVEESLSYIRSHADALEIPIERITASDVHIHFPGTITEADCRSLGMSVVIVLASLFAEMPVHHDYAFSGDITLRGRVSPVGSVEEKVFAAHRSEIRKVFLSSHNRRDVDDLPDELSSDIEFVFVDSVSEAIEQALMKIILPGGSLDQSLENITKEQQNDSNTE
jgi:ATP-dependent Lon protease